MASPERLAPVVQLDDYRNGFERARQRHIRERLTELRRELADRAIETALLEGEALRLERVLEPQAEGH